MTQKPNIVPCIAVEIPPLALNVLIDAMSAYVQKDDPDKLPETTLRLLIEIRNEYQLKTA